MPRQSKTADPFPSEEDEQLIDPDDGVPRPVIMKQFNPAPLYQMREEADTQIRSFSELLDTLPMDLKLKLLWKQVYENAVNDRKNAMMVWCDLYSQVHGDADKHAIHGDRIAKYMERMEKSNQQLLKLAELVYKVKEQEEADNIPTGNDLFDLLETNKQKKSK